jgi:hypothetical protein
MQSVHRLVPVIALALLSTTAWSSTTTYTSSADFLAQVAAGSYANTFDGLGSSPLPVFSGGGFSYSLSAPNGIYGSGDFIGVNQVNDALTITFTGAAVTALGANFFATDLSDSFQSVLVTVTLSDGTIASFTPTLMADSYRGFTSTAAISSLVIAGAGASLYSGLDNFTVGAAAVPEPASWALFGLGVAGVLAARRRKA